MKKTSVIIAVVVAILLLLGGIYWHVSHRASVGEVLATAFEDGGESSFLLTPMRVEDSEFKAGDNETSGSYLMIGGQGIRLVRGANVLKVAMVDNVASATVQFMPASGKVMQSATIAEGTPRLRPRAWGGDVPAEDNEAISIWISWGGDPMRRSTCKVPGDAERILISGLASFRRYHVPYFCLTVLVGQSEYSTFVNDNGPLPFGGGPRSPMSLHETISQAELGKLVERSKGNWMSEDAWDGLLSKAHGNLSALKSRELFERMLAADVRHMRNERDSVKAVEEAWLLLMRHVMGGGAPSPVVRRWEIPSTQDTVFVVRVGANSSRVDYHVFGFDRRGDFSRGGILSTPPSAREQDAILLLHRMLTEPE